MGSQEQRDDGDAALVAAARDGDVAAYGELVARHAPMVYRVTVRMLGNRQDAEDVTQDVFLRAWRSLERFRGDSTLTTWLYRIATNQCLNLLRRRARTEVLPPDDVVVSTSPGPDRVSEARAQMAELHHVLASLAPEQRAVLVLRELEGCSHEEIAEILGISVGAARVRMHRARAAVVEAMEEWA